MIKEYTENDKLITPMSNILSSFTRMHLTIIAESAERSMGESIMPLENVTIYHLTSRKESLKTHTLVWLMNTMEI